MTVAEYPRDVSTVRGRDTERGKLSMRTKSSVAERFWRSVDTSGDCYLWLGVIQSTGYGAFWNGERRVQAHRYSYELSGEQIPAGLQLDHLCRVRSCVKREHLEPVTNRENQRRGLKGVLLTHCPKGHEYTPDNTIHEGGASKGRRCRACRTAQRKLYDAERWKRIRDEAAEWRRAWKATDSG